MARLAPTALSPFEHLLLGTKRPVSMLAHIFHTCYLDTNIADHLITVLPRSTMLTLRAVSPTTKDWVEEHHPDLIKRLRVTCPLPRFSIQASSTLRRLAVECTHLVIVLLPSATPIPAGTIVKPTPARQIFNFVHNFTSLRIELPTTHAFEPLLSLRQALESGPWGHSPISTSNRLAPYLCLQYAGVVLTLSGKPRGPVGGSGALSKA